LQARKLKALMESTFGWDLEDNAVNLIDEDDEVIWIMITSIIISPLLHIG
jgi:A1 cistron-splicing factor AAR2